MNKRVVITGWGIVSPFGLSNNDFEKDFDSTLAYRVKDDWEKEGIGSQYFGGIPNFDVLKKIDSLKPPFPNRYSSIGLLACLNALKDADLYGNDKLLNKAGLILTTTLGASKAVQTFLTKLYKRGPDRLSPFNFSKATSNSILGDISRILQLKGPGSLVYGEESVSYGLDLIRNEHADIVVCGGVDEITELNVFLAKKKDRLLNPNELSVFNQLIESIEENKSIFSESSSFVVIESLESALKRKAKVYAEIIDSKQFRDKLSSKVIFERSSSCLEEGLTSFLKKHNLTENDNILFYGSGCLPWHVKEYEWKALEKIPYNFKYANSKVSIGECLSGSSNTTLVSSLLAYSKNRLANVLKDSIPLKDKPNNISLENFDSNEEFITITHTFSLGGSSTLLMLKKYNK